MTSIPVAHRKLVCLANAKGAIPTPKACRYMITAPDGFSWVCVAADPIMKPIQDQKAETGRTIGRRVNCPGTP